MGAPITEWLLSRNAEFAQWTTLLGAVSAFLVASEKVLKSLSKVVVALLELFGRKRKEKKEEDRAKGEKRGQATMKDHLRTAQRKRFLFLGVLFAVLFVGLSTTRYVLAQKLPLNARLTKEAWDAFNSKDWQTAVRKADECIEQFRDQADDRSYNLRKAT